MFTIFRGPTGLKTFWIAFLCIIPVGIYFLVFKLVALNINYIAFDDIQVLQIIPGFANAGWADRWKLLTELFPEHRLVFSRTVILVLHRIFGTIDMVGLMIVANLCWAACTLFFYGAFRRLHLSIWYFVPVTWLWFNIQSFENIFWGVSSLCNFGVILFVLCALYFAAFRSKQFYLSLLFAVLATFTYGNGLVSFPVIGMVAWLLGRRRDFLITIGVAALTCAVYFADFHPITQNLDLSNFGQVRDGFFGYFGFIGSIATISAYDLGERVLTVAVVTGFVFVSVGLYMFRNQFVPLFRAVMGREAYTNPVLIFALGIAAFVAITALLIVYKRIPGDGFEGMFKGRYRMYSTLWCIAMYLSMLALVPRPYPRFLIGSVISGSIIVNLLILHGNFADALNNRRAAIVQEFNARYNEDWLGLRMFEFEQSHFEKIRAYYKSEDPLAEGWNPGSGRDSVDCAGELVPDAYESVGDYIVLGFNKVLVSGEKDFSDGVYAIFKSSTHTYAAGRIARSVPVKTSLRRLMYFKKDTYFNLHRGVMEPGFYSVFLLVRKNGKNKIYCTGKTWNEK